MQPNEVAFLTALGATLLLSLIVILCLRKALQGILLDLCGTEQRARFWSIYTNILLVLMPVAAVLIARPSYLGDRSLLFAVADQVL